MGRIGLVASKHSRKNRRDGALFDRLAEAAGQGSVARLVGTEDDLRAAAEDFRAAGVTFVAIAGGDGTNGRVISALRGPYGDGKMPIIGYLRGGTMNTVANGVGVPRLEPMELLQKYVQDVANDAVTTNLVRTLVVRSGGGNTPAGTPLHKTLAEPRAGFLAGTGAVYNFLRAYYRAPDPTAWNGADVLVRSALGTMLPHFAPLTGEIAAGWEGGVEFRELGFEGPRAANSSGGSRWSQRRWLSVLVGTVPEIGLGFRPFPLALARRDRFQVIGVDGTPGALVGALPRIRLGLKMGSKVALNAFTDRAEFSSRDDRTGFMLDGDLYEHEGPVVVELGPEVPLAN